MRKIKSVTVSIMGGLGVSKYTEQDGVVMIEAMPCALAPFGGKNMPSISKLTLSDLVNEGTTITSQVTDVEYFDDEEATVTQE